MMPRTQKTIFIYPALVLFSTFSSANEEIYLREIKPILKERCYACHGALKQEADLRLDTGKLVRKGSENGSILDFQDVDKSILIERITSADDDLRMPPIGKPLSNIEVARFKAWISKGAKSKVDEVSEESPNDHWAFQPVKRPSIPKAKGSLQSASAIDQFIIEGYRRKGLRPVAEAQPSQLIRRLYLDLTGLPPSPKQVKEFTDDPNSQTYSAIVDRLLDSKQYGERWARHWMDIWRYSDWYGRRQQNDVRNSAPQIWRWRDWIVDSLNDDKSYARMIQEMLAADEIAPLDDSAWPATGFLIRNYYSLNPNEWMRHNVEFTGKAFLGLTFNCAHCHDHKYDPIEQEDYFRMRAFFEPIGIRQDRVVGEPEPPLFEPYTYAGSRKVVRLGMVRVYDEKPTAPTWFYSGGDERNRIESRGSIAPGIPSFFASISPKIQSMELPLQAWYPGARPNIQKMILEECEQELESARKNLAVVQSKKSDSSRQEKAWLTAKQQLQDVIKKEIASGKSSALNGQQSFYMDAAKGRSIFQNNLTTIRSISEGTTISFRVKILQDSHFNFQLARDATKHLTALYVGFVGGEIKAYRPGSFSEFKVGSYDFGKEENEFLVSMTILPSSDTAKLKVQNTKTLKTIVAAVPIALNGWNPTKNAHQPITFDCRTGSRVMIDDVKIDTGSSKLVFDFEPTKFEDGVNINGIEGWIENELSLAPAYAVITQVEYNENIRAAFDRLTSAKLAFDVANGLPLAAKLRVQAAEAKLESIKAVIEADNAIKGKANPKELKKLAVKARQAQRNSRLLNARWKVLDLKAKLNSIEKKSTPAKQVTELKKQLAAAEKRLKQIQIEKNENSQEDSYQKLSPTFSKQSTGRRRALAQWITDKRNPLTARVAVNHIWMRHFHSPLVESVFDFGRNGKQPTHPKLLDWLACELMENDWSMKHLHRLIVNSRTYKLSSSISHSQINLEEDRDNRFLWRMNVGRMDAEQVRDSILCIANELDLKMGGQPLANSQSMSTFRRSLFYEVFPEDGGKTKLGSVFDAPSQTECFRRTSTVIPQQALALSNSQNVHRASAKIAKGLGEKMQDTEMIDDLFLRVLNRSPKGTEVQVIKKFLVKQRDLLMDENKVRESLIRVLFNHNDFVTIR